MAKKTKSSASNLPLGTGARFASLKNKLKRQGKSEESATKIAAWIGQKKYGKKQMAKWAAQNRKKK